MADTAGTTGTAGTAGAGGATIARAMATSRALSSDGSENCARGAGEETGAGAGRGMILRGAGAGADGGGGRGMILRGSGAGGEVGFVSTCCCCFGRAADARGGFAINRASSAGGGGAFGDCSAHEPSKVTDFAVGGHGRRTVAPASAVSSSTKSDHRLPVRAAS